MTDITPIIQTAIALVLLICGCFAVPYLKTKVSVEKLDETMKYIAIAVQAAEQIITTAGMGSAKKRYVLNWLQAHNITYDPDKVDAMIESAVYELINKFRGLPLIEEAATADLTEEVSE